MRCSNELININIVINSIINNRTINYDSEQTGLCHGARTDPGDPYSVIS